VKDVDTIGGVALLANNKLINWERVSLPHTPRVGLIDDKDQWQGTCYYRKNVNIAAADQLKHIALQFDTAMHEADQKIFPLVVAITIAIDFGCSTNI